MCRYVSEITRTFLYLMGTILGTKNNRIEGTFTAKHKTPLRNRRGFLPSCNKHRKVFLEICGYKWYSLIQQVQKIPEVYTYE